MSERSYYRLVRGDYIQSGDEFCKEKTRQWVPINEQFFGLKYGYSMKKVNEPVSWAPCRRLVPTDFKTRKKELIVGCQEQWGEEFEV